MCPGGLFVVEDSVFETAVEDAHEPVSEGPEGLVVEVAGCASLVVEPAGAWTVGGGTKRPLVEGVV